MSAFKRKSSYSIESGLKYFIIGALSSALFLFGSSIVYGCMGSLSFDDLQMFFSLLFASDVQTSQFIISSSLNNCSNNELALGSYDLAYNKSLLGLIGVSFASSDPALVHSIAMSTEDSLIDWCNINKFTNISAPVFSVSTFTTVDWFTISNSIKDSWFLTQFSADSLITEFQFFSNRDIWSCLLVSDTSELSEKLFLLKQIFASYVNVETIGSVSNVSMLNTDLVSVGFLLICISLFIKLSIAPFHFWSLDVYEGSPNSTTFFLL